MFKSNISDWSNQYSRRFDILKVKQRYQGMFKTPKSGNKTSSGENGLNIRTNASPKVAQDQMSGRVSVPSRHATPITYAPWKRKFWEMSDSVKISGILSKSCIRSNRYRVSLVSPSSTNVNPNGTGPGVRRSKRLLLEYRTRCKCSIETSHKWVKSQIR